MQAPKFVDKKVFKTFINSNSEFVHTAAIQIFNTLSESTNEFSWLSVPPTPKPRVSLSEFNVIIKYIKHKYVEGKFNRALYGALQMIEMIRNTIKIMLTYEISNPYMQKIQLSDRKFQRYINTHPLSSSQKSFHSLHSYLVSQIGISFLPLDLFLTLYKECKGLQDIITSNLQAQEEIQNTQKVTHFFTTRQYIIKIFDLYLNFILILESCLVFAMILNSIRDKTHDTLLSNPAFKHHFSFKKSSQYFSTIHKNVLAMWKSVPTGFTSQFPAINNLLRLENNIPDPFLDLISRQKQENTIVFISCSDLRSRIIAAEITTRINKYSNTSMTICTDFEHPKNFDWVSLDDIVNLNTKVVLYPVVDASNDRLIYAQNLKIAELETASYTVEPWIQIETTVSRHTINSKLKEHLNYRYNLHFFNKSNIRIWIQWSRVIMNEPQIPICIQINISSISLNMEAESNDVYYPSILTLQQSNTLSNKTRLYLIDYQKLGKSFIPFSIIHTKEIRNTVKKLQSLNSKTTCWGIQLTQPMLMNSIDTISNKLQLFQHQNNFYTEFMKKLEQLLTDTSE